MRALAALAVVVALTLAGVQSALADGPPPASTAPPITITGFSPSSGLVGTTVTITGTGFDVIDNVGFAGGDWTPFTLVSSTQVVATVPNTITGKIVVTSHNYTPTITVFSAADFVIIPPPRIDLIEPARAPAGSTIRIRGAFLDTATSVTYNGAAVGFSAGLDSLQPSYSIVTAQVPADATSGAFTVVTPGGSATTGAFTVLAAPPAVATPAVATAAPSGPAATSTTPVAPVSPVITATNAPKVAAPSSLASPRAAAAGVVAKLAPAGVPALTAAAHVTRNARGAIVRADISLVAPRSMTGQEVLVQGSVKAPVGTSARWVTLGEVTVRRGVHSTLRITSAAGLALARAGARLRFVNPSTLTVVAGGTLTIRA